MARITVGNLLSMQAGLERTALILVGPALNPGEFRESALYAPDYDRRFRPSSGDGAGRS